MGRGIARATLSVAALAVSLLLRPLAPLGGAWGHVVPNLLLGAAAAACGVLLEVGLAALGPATAAGAVAGALLGAWAVSSAMRLASEDAGAALALVALVAAYACAGAGARFARTFERRASAPRLSVARILDTSVLIDGRIADLCECGFVEGTLVVPSFVLSELQYIADSAEPLRRARGRRGLEIVSRLKQSQALDLVFSEEEFPEIREVDQKLIELARRMDGKLVTNDYNLSKVASIRGVGVLNLNDLSHSLKALVLPGETLRVAVIREGKEPHQGVAYLDDGTMLVVEQARAAIGRSVDVVVTSVLQTTAGRMFFGRLAGEPDKT